MATDAIDDFLDDIDTDLLLLSEDDDIDDSDFKRRLGLEITDNERITRPNSRSSQPDYNIPNPGNNIDNNAVVMRSTPPLANNINIQNNNEKNNNNSSGGNGNDPHSISPTSLYKRGMMNGVVHMELQENSKIPTLREPVDRSNSGWVPTTGGSGNGGEKLEEGDVNLTEVFLRSKDRSSAALAYSKAGVLTQNKERNNKKNTNNTSVKNPLNPSPAPAASQPPEWPDLAPMANANQASVATTSTEVGPVQAAVSQPAPSPGYQHHSYYPYGRPFPLPTTVNNSHAQPPATPPPSLLPPSSINNNTSEQTNTTVVPTPQTTSVVTQRLMTNLPAAYNQVRPPAQAAPGPAPGNQSVSLSAAAVATAAALANVVVANGIITVDGGVARVGQGKDARNKSPPAVVAKRTSASSYHGGNETKTPSPQETQQHVNGQNVSQMAAPAPAPTATAGIVTKPRESPTQQPYNPHHHAPPAASPTAAPAPPPPQKPTNHMNGTTTTIHPSPIAHPGQPSYTAYKAPPPLPSPNINLHPPYHHHPPILPQPPPNHPIPPNTTHPSMPPPHPYPTAPFYPNTTTNPSHYHHHPPPRYMTLMPNSILDASKKQHQFGFGGNHIVPSIPPPPVKLMRNQPNNVAIAPPPPAPPVAAPAAAPAPAPTTTTTAAAASAAAAAAAAAAGSNNPAAYERKKQRAKDGRIRLNESIEKLSVAMSLAGQMSHKRYEQVSGDDDYSSALKKSMGDCSAIAATAKKWDRPGFVGTAAELVQALNAQCEALARELMEGREKGRKRASSSEDDMVAMSTRKRIKYQPAASCIDHFRSIATHGPILRTLASYLSPRSLTTLPCVSRYIHHIDEWTSDYIWKPLCHLRFSNDVISKIKQTSSFMELYRHCVTTAAPPRLPEILSEIEGTVPLGTGRRDGVSAWAAMIERSNGETLRSVKTPPTNRTSAKMMTNEREYHSLPIVEMCLVLQNTSVETSNVIVPDQVVSVDASTKRRGEEFFEVMSDDRLMKSVLLEDSNTGALVTAPMEGEGQLVKLRLFDTAVLTVNIYARGCPTGKIFRRKANFTKILVTINDVTVPVVVPFGNGKKNGGSGERVMGDKNTKVAMARM